MNHWSLVLYAIVGVGRATWTAAWEVCDAKRYEFDWLPGDVVILTVAVIFQALFWPIVFAFVALETFQCGWRHRRQ